jgi:hypothetical protein
MWQDVWYPKALESSNDRNIAIIHILHDDSKVAPCCNTQDTVEDTTA